MDPLDTKPTPSQSLYLEPDLLATGSRSMLTCPSWWTYPCLADAPLRRHSAASPVRRRRRKTTHSCPPCSAPRPVCSRRRTRQQLLPAGHEDNGLLAQRQVPAVHEKTNDFLFSGKSWPSMKTKLSLFSDKTQPCKTTNTFSRYSPAGHDAIDSSSSSGRP